MKAYRIISIIVCIVCIFFSISLSLHVYPSINYNIQYHLQDINTNINQTQYTTATTNLRYFFLHTQKLDQSIFTPEEIQHYNEVRNIYDVIIIISLISTLLLFLLKPKSTEISSALKKIGLGLPILFFILPWFATLFNGIFHTTLFSNSLWIMHPNQISYYIFPYEFFLISFISIIIMMELFTLGSYYSIKRKKAKRQEHTNV